MSLRARTLLAVLATFAAATSLVPLRAIADDKHDDLSRTQDQLSSIEGVLRDARADASALSMALTSANEEVSLAEARLELSVLADRAITLNYVAADGADTLSRLDMARRRADMLHQQMVQVERERVAATEAVSSQVTDLRKVRAVRQQAKQALDAKISRLAGQAASLRAHSTELRRLIQQEEAARAREAAARRASAATSTTTPAAPAAPAPPAPSDHGRCDLSGTSAAERWIIMHESSGDPTADNPTSTAFGLGQLLLGNRILYLGKDYATTDCGKQLAAFRTYVRERYGTAEAAQAFWQSHGWY